MALDLDLSKGHVFPILHLPHLAAYLCERQVRARRMAGTPAGTNHLGR